jgi:hypothetical protein
MRFVLRLLAVLLAASILSPAEAQTEYFTNGQPVVGLRGTTTTAEGQRAFGFGLEAMVTPKVGGTFSFSQSTAESDFEQLDVNVFSLGVQAYPARQGLDGAITLGMAFGLGILSGNGVDAKTINVGVQAAHVIGAAKPGVQLVPKAELALVLALAETTAAASQAIGVGMGIALRATPEFVIILEPNVSVAFGSGESQTFFGAAFGVGFSI